MAGKITSNPSETSDADGNKAVQVKVPVVATVIQNIEADGKFSFAIEPPGAEQEQGKPCQSYKTKCFCRFYKTKCFCRNVSLHLLLSDDLVTALDTQFSLSDSYPDEVNRQNSANSTPSMDECNELLELAAQGGIQFVRATEDGRYEVIWKRLVHSSMKLCWCFHSVSDNSHVW